MKKLIVTMLICGMTVSMCACGSKAEEAAPAETTVAVEEATTVAEETTVAETTEEATEAGTTAEAEGTVTGIVTDASMTNMMIQAEDGTFYMFTEDDNTDVSCADGILLGEVVDVAFTGTQEAGDAVAVTVSDSTVTAKADREALEFAISVIQTMQFMDQDTLGTMMTYPTYVSVGDIDDTIADADAFKALDRDTLFSQDLVVAISDYNLFNLESSEAGYVIGDGKPNVIFKEDTTNSFGFGITGINGNK